MSFELEYEPLDRTHPDEGSAALLPWDEAVFGFRVAALQIGDATPAGAVDHWAIDRWAEANRVELIAAECPAGDAEKRLALERHRFALVDVVVTAVHPRLGRVEIAPPKREPRLATRDDLPRLEEIAAGAFRYGRYHADPFFPRALADARYRQWVRNAFESGDPLLVSETAAGDRGFFHVVVRGTDLDLRLTAVDPSKDDPWAGTDLLHAALRFGQSLGARRAVARLSSANTAVMNLYAATGFRFDAPSAVYHWRSSRMRDGVMA